MKQSIKLNSTRQNIWVFSNTLRTLNSKHHAHIVGDSVLRLHLFSSCIARFPTPTCTGLLNEHSTIAPQRLCYVDIFYAIHTNHLSPFLERMLANSMSGNSAKTLNHNLPHHHHHQPSPWDTTTMMWHHLMVMMHNIIAICSESVHPCPPFSLWHGFQVPCHWQRHGNRTMDDD